MLAPTRSATGYALVVDEGGQIRPDRAYELGLIVEFFEYRGVRFELARQLLVVICRHALRQCRLFQVGQACGQRGRSGNDRIAFSRDGMGGNNGRQAGEQSRQQAKTNRIERGLDHVGSRLEGLDHSSQPTQLVAGLRGTNRSRLIAATALQEMLFCASCWRLDSFRQLQ